MSNGSWMDVGNAVLQIGRGIADWIGAGTLVDEVVEGIEGGGKKRKLAEIQAKIQKEASKVANQYGIDLNEVYTRLANLGGLPSSNIIKEAVNKEKEKLRNKAQEITDKVNEKQKLISSASQYVSDLQSKNRTGVSMLDNKTISTAQDLVKKIEGGS